MKAFWNPPNFALFNGASCASALSEKRSCDDARLLKPFFAKTADGTFARFLLLSPRRKKQNEKHKEEK
jgi:hypothetical protein